MAEYIEIKQQEFSFFGKGSSITGKFNLRGTTRLSSSVEGELTMTDSSDLTIETEGQFLGTINCHNVEIHGRFSGKINATGKVTIFPSAFVKGELIARSINIGPGASVNINGHTLEK
ncbi:polymer-forming cytoskeletal family protein [Bacteriovorax sp. BSW11_IV]|uniref:bactofilin family protein n=1 Tax=Bacteriovorax sp. BSW11_IV TaxID=1353529 RepID=UPI00038A295F|nr:polymer-forming cytoskeletal protein [Bacteriovorax sp. BSW11_IV]EQC45028.1 polymer-forming cytoskeletal family protein [Bacteriovorax sp. BSW11_IV]